MHFASRESGGHAEPLGGGSYGVQLELFFDERRLKPAPVKACRVLLKK